MIHLSWQDWSTVISLQGGGILTLERGSQTLMVPGTLPPQLASFAMVPFCSRVAHGRFVYQGRQIQLAPNFLPEPHTLHGFGWECSWQLREETPRSCILWFDHDERMSQVTGWPWAFSVEQSFTLDDDALTVSARVCNLASSPMPVGLGWHPHFPITADTDVQLQCAGAMSLDPKFLDAQFLDAFGIPVSGARELQDQQSAVQHNPLAARPWTQRHLDDVYVWRSGPASIAWPNQPWSLSIEPDSSLPHWVVYAPTGEEFICIEPISHLPGALNLSSFDAQSGLRELAPGEHWSATTRFVTRPS